MKIELLSDLHFEFHRDHGAGFVAALQPADVDVLIVAGDLATLPLLDGALTALCERYPAVVYVVGNHEYYGSHPERVHAALARAEARLPNLHWLHHRTATIDGVAFAGTPLWFPHSPAADPWRHRMNDFRLIEGFEPWVYEENARALDFLEAKSSEVDVVVTHHLPSERSVVPRFRGSPLRPWFVCDVDRLVGVGRQRLWVHGHTHAACDYRLGGARVLCNPLAYPHEVGTGFVEGLRVVV